MGMLGMRAMFVSTGVVSMAVILRVSLPVMLASVGDKIPVFLSTWLRPPYLYLLINCIILSIVASSKLHPRGGTADEDQVRRAAYSSLSTPLPDKEAKDDGEVVEEERERNEEGKVEVAAEREVVFGYVEGLKEDAAARSEDSEERVVDRRVEKEEEEKENVPVEVKEDKPEKPPVSGRRFGQRRGVKASPEGKTVLRVSRPKRQETLESTWRTITEGRAMPLKRHLKKSDTFAGTQDTSLSPLRVMKKSDTFSNIGNSSPGSGGGKLRREPSLSQDELNRRVEAFIKKFNEEMRLQRQESFNHYRTAVGSTIGV